MDGTKLIADTIDYENSGKQAFLQGRSICESRCGPVRIENPGVSRIVAEWESLPP